MTRVTVAINVYNGMPFLPDALDSIRNQTLRDIQIIVVNDGSTDDSRQYLSSVDDPRLRVIDQPNAGPSVASNTAIADCQTEYLARMDADDIAVPDRIESQLAFMEANPSVGMIGGQTANMGTRGLSRSINLPNAHEEIWNALNSGHHAMAHPTLFMRTALIQQVGGYWSHRLADDDIDVMLRMGEVAQLGNLDQIVLHYRLRQDSLCGLDMSGIRFSADYAIELGRRRRSNQPAITPDEFRERQQKRPWVTRTRESLETYALKQYRVATEEMFGEHALRGRIRLAWAAICSPDRTVRRLKRMLRPARQATPNTTKSE